MSASSMHKRRTAQVQAGVNPQKQAADEAKLAISEGRGAANVQLRDVQLADNKKKGADMVKALTALGQDSGQEFENAATMAAYGYHPQTMEQPFLSKAGKALSILDIPGALVRFGIADIFGGDTKYGTELGWKDFKDVWGGNVEGIKARHGEDFVGEEGRMSGQQLLTIAGWELDERLEEGGTGGKYGNWAKRNVHGLISFGVEMITDPLSFVTGGASAAGKKAGLTASNQLVRKSVANSVKHVLKKSADDGLSAFEKAMAKQVRSKADEMLEVAAKEIDGPLSDGIVRDIYERAGTAVGDEKMAEVGKAIANRDYAALSDDFVSYAKENGEAWLTGGLRVTRAPMARGGVQIPGTRGLGRKVSRTVFGTHAQSTATRGFLGRSTAGKLGTGIRGQLDRSFKATTRWRNMFHGVDADSSLVRAFQEGRGTAVDLLKLQSAVKGTANKTGLRQLGVKIGQAGDALNRSLKKHLSTDEADDIFKSMLGGIQDGRLIAKPARHVNPKVNEAVDNFVSAWREGFDAMHEIAVKNGVEIGHLDNYIPLIRSREMNELFGLMQDGGLGVAIPEAAEGELRRGYEMFAEMYGAWLRRAKMGRKAVGEFKHAEHRVLGIGVDINDMGDVTLVQKLTGETGSIGHISHTQLNDEMTMAILDLAERQHLPINAKRFNALEMNPYEVANKYMNSMNDAIMETILVKQGRALGLIKGGDFAINRGKMGAALKERLGNLTKKGEKRIAKTIDDTHKGLEDVRGKVARGETVPPSRKPKVRKEKVGDTSIPVPEHVADDPRVEKALREARRKWDNKLTNRRAAMERAKVRKQELKKAGLPDEVADQLGTETEFEIINDIYRAVEQAEREDIERQTAAAMEVIAREAASAERDLGALKAAKKAEKAAHDKQAATARGAAEEARARFAGRNKLRPRRVAQYRTPAEQRQFGEHLKPGTGKKMEMLAVQAEQLPEGRGRLLAEKLRSLGTALDEVEEWTPEIIMELQTELKIAQNLAEAINGGGEMQMSVVEWIKTRPPRRTKMGALEQERIMDEWLELAPTTSRVPDAPPRPKENPIVEELKRGEGMNLSGEASDEVTRQQVLTETRLLRDTSDLEVRELGEVTANTGEVFRVRQIKQGGGNRVWAEDGSGQVVSAAALTPGGGGSAGAHADYEGVGVFGRMMAKAVEDDENFVIRLSLSQSVSDDMKKWIMGWARRQSPTDPAQEVMRREAWFEAFAEANGVDLRMLLAPDRKKLKTLLTDPPDSPELMAQLQRSKDRILGVKTGRPMPKGQARSVQHMFLDRVEGYKGARGQRRPEWAKIDVEEARQMDPEDFFATYGEVFGEGILTDKVLEGVQDAHKILYDDGFLGKNLDQSVAYTLGEELEVLQALQAGAFNWRDQRLRARLTRMFDESGMGAEYTIRSARGGKFQIESIEKVETLSQTALMRELKLAGYDSIEDAAFAVAEGSLKPGVLSQAAKNTLAETPTADMRALDELADVMRQRVKAVGDPAIETADRTLREAAFAEKRLERLNELMRRVGADGQIRPAALKEAQAILADKQTMRTLRRMLPSQDWPRIDGIQDTLNTWAVYRDADSRVKAVLRDNQALRQELMFDPTETQSLVKQVIDEVAQMRTDQALGDLTAQAEMLEALGRVIEDLFGLADLTPGRGMWTRQGEATYEMIEILGKQGEEYARRLGLDEIGDVMMDVKNTKLGLVPTTEAEGFLPAVAFGLGGKNVDKAMVQADLGRFMEQTLNQMTAGMTPVGLQSFASQLRQVLHWWKGMATVARPTFHVRNTISALWNNNMINVQLKDYAFVARNHVEIQKLFGETNDWVKAAQRMKDPTARFYYEQAALAGIFDSTFTTREVLGKMAREATGTKWSKNPLGTKGALLNAGGFAMSNIENYMRMAAFVRHMPHELLGEADEALLSAGRTFANDMVNMVHFDYANLTHFEERIKDFIPFYVWTRRNLPLQMRALVESPRNIATYNHLIHVGNDMSSSRDDRGPRKYGGDMFIGTDMYLNEDTDNWAQLILDPDLPVKDLFRIEDPLSPMSYVNLVVGMLAPQYSTTAKAVFEDPYQTTAPVGFSAVVRAHNALLDPNKNWDTNPRVSSRVASLMKLAFPPASEYLTAFEQDPVRMQKQGIVDGDVGSRVKAGLRDLILPGLGFQTSTPHSEYSVYQGSAFDLDDEKRELQKQGQFTKAEYDMAKKYGAVFEGLLP